MPKSGIVVLEKMMLPASRSRAAGGASLAAGTSLVVAVRSGTATPGRDIVLDGDGNAVERPHRLALLPALGRGLGSGARAVGIERVKRLDVGLPQRDMRQQIVEHFAGRELPGAKPCDHVDG